MFVLNFIYLWYFSRSSRVYKRRGGSSGLGDDFGMGCGGGDRLDDARTPLVTPKMRSFEDSPYKPIPAERLAQHVASYHVDDDAGYQAEFEAGICPLYYLDVTSVLFLFSFFLASATCSSSSDPSLMYSTILQAHRPSFQCFPSVPLTSFSKS